MNKTKAKIYLFTDGSVSPQSKIGFGAYLLLDTLEVLPNELQKKIKVKRFKDSSSTKLELETLLWALNEESLINYKIEVYTDCQNIIGLKDRRERLEKNEYMTSKDKVIKNHELYKDFFKRLDILDCEFIKVKGHKKSSTKNKIDEIFTLVDRTTRKALRESVL
ncbi:ribonuclease H [Sulfurimonas aquatica]|uniref:Ribonuclease H n=1 Tax=Sulfurimonas aquatica TaxID=2672570 RepID=A0A975B2E5_9BACT|nr:RNase H family protein [Sulfurimonas aquatica]QSZ42855.1 ribonuclease H [Sulfurimonas aquatica]